MTDASREPLALATEFPAACYEDWRRLVETALKGTPFERLIVRSHDGLPVEPIHRRQAQARPLLRHAPGMPWQVVQRVDHPDPAAANAEVRHELDNGASGLSLVFAGAIGGYGYGLPPGPEALARLLEGIPVTDVAFDLDLSIPSREAPLQVAAWAKQRGIDPAALQLRCGLDPLRSLVTEGASPLRWPELAALLARLATELAALGLRGPVAVADGRVIHNAGGSEAQELSYVLAAAVAYLRALESGGVGLEEARHMIYFRLSADADQFLTIAKFRAARKLWSSIEHLCGLAPEPVLIVAETAWRMMTRYDPHTNMLRTTIATAAAGLGGADAITVLPFTAAIGLPDSFARRMARNTQLVLLEESNLARVTDPAAGSGGIEALTDQLSQAAWVQFQEIEAAGGACAALESGLIQRQVASIRAQRAAAVATRRDALVGTSEFATLAETDVRVLDMAPVAVPPLAVTALSAEPLPRMRLAEPFEALRDASDRQLAASGARPKVFLANLGPPAEFAARANFARTLFAAGGIDAVSEEAASEPAALAAAFKASGAKLACLCSSDEAYAREAAAAAKALAAAGARHIYLVGRPRDGAAPTAAGIGTFIFAGCDVLAVLRNAYDHLER
jgi:methylmalonyl-CoA mutase